MSPLKEAREGDGIHQVGEMIDNILETGGPPKDNLERKKSR